MILAPLHVHWFLPSLSHLRSRRSRHRFRALHFIVCGFCPSSIQRTKARLTMSYGGNIEGYLIKIDGREVRTVYCILDEGMLQYFLARVVSSWASWRCQGPRLKRFYFLHQDLVRCPTSSALTRSHEVRPFVSVVLRSLRVLTSWCR